MRYSLRSLALVVTLVAVLLGNWTNRALDQRRTIARIQSLGGDVDYAPSKFPLLERYLDRDFVASVVAVQLYQLQPESFDYVVDDTALVDCVRLLPAVKHIEGLKGNHQSMAERIRAALPQVEVRLYHGGII